MAVLTALALHDMEDMLPYEVDLVAHRTKSSTGARPILCRENFFRSYQAAIMDHASSNFSVCCEKFLALNDYIIRFHGQAAHAASEPWMGRNALNGAMLAIHALDMLRQHLRPETRLLAIIRSEAPLLM